MPVGLVLNWVFWDLPIAFKILIVEGGQNFNNFNKLLFYYST